MSEEAKTGWQLLPMDDEGAGILAYAVGDGQISEGDVAPIWPRFDAAAASGNKIRVYAEMHAMPSVSGGMIVEKLKHLKNIMSTVERMALVGDAGWMEIYAKLADPITKAEIRHFSLDQSEAAKNWIWE
ncbi:MAG: STAS/SEC14 domain-containing protein [Gammaproteobacteria bacterium]|nr:STAS/SEC14 domain-containing protein [Gammaproteobacteria bacterium]NND37841.1 STAS/SEC14 domain-containing protein [Gammaproteobacteria bacterium]